MIKKNTITITKEGSTNNVLPTYIYKNNYNIIIYLLLKKDYTYRHELNRLLNVNNNWEYYFNKLIKDNIIEQININQDDYSYLVNKPCVGKYNIDKAKFYTLTDEAREFYNYKPNYDSLSNQFTNDLEEYVLDYKTKVKLHNEEIDNRHKSPVDILLEQFKEFEKEELENE